MMDDLDFSSGNLSNQTSKVGFRSVARSFTAGKRREGGQGGGARHFLSFPIQRRNLKEMNPPLSLTLQQCAFFLCVCALDDIPRGWSVLMDSQMVRFAFPFRKAPSQRRESRPLNHIKHAAPLCWAVEQCRRVGRPLRHYARCFLLAGFAKKGKKKTPKKRKKLKEGHKTSGGTKRLQHLQLQTKQQD